MWHTFVMELKSSLRTPAVLFWIIAFPIILATLIQSVFGTIASGDVTLEVAPVAVVADNTWNSNPGADTFVNAFSTSSTSAGTSSEPTGSSSTAGKDGDITLFKRIDAADVAEAETLLRQGKALAYLSVEDSGDLRLTLSRNAATDIAQTKSGGSDGQAWSLITLGTLVEQYNERSRVIAQAIAQAAANDPSKLADGAWIASLAGANFEEITRQASGIRHAEGMVRYHVAILAMSILMAMSMTCNMLSALQANLSPLGARVSVSPLSRFARIGAVLLSSWLATFLCMLVVYAYMRIALGVSFPGREGLAILAIAIGSGMANCLGLVLGAIPVISLGVKSGISVAFSLILSIFTGLYGNMAFADSVQRAVPGLQYLNPAKQVTNLFYDLLYYDSLAPFARTVGVIAAMSAIALGVAAFELRKVSYDHL
ncbi:ABC transporter permease [Bifidobacterium thermophilum]|uniref:ABC transporter permease n=1 Tax=Bifidobacterium thermophilum TaxID=33905 RepID=UPI0030A73307